ncbi:bifunctional metallophosphatase/5'-nucleotidase [Flavihumibacter petaseus]|uniref:Putative 5'-nucleotidase n=1 Tax=Flavihumibacter petaseus NBRC 106054 TaxID=1220578 RepID=A0A0E9N4M9_9BACT|nr:metallophosphoesterase [Flavihumibacter petaseus]GAO44902.1 putative 5'-nucleotidase [Flavihumibacter petaseus NBRC 106054]
MPTRKRFIQQTALATGAFLAGGMLNSAVAADAEAEVEKLTILHTNDVHSRLEPFPMDGSRNQGLGGVAARALEISKVRAEQRNVLLLDAGDIFQGTPFFNFYKGEPEMKAMTMMGYDACTMGNHDFDAGMENFATQMKHAKFPVILCNYDFTGTPLEYKTVPYTIINKGKLKIGITGVGIEMKGLVPDNLYGNTQYLDPVVQANRVAEQLKRQDNCDMVICLSHLGFRYREPKVSDEIFAKESVHIDLIIGGHTHTFFDAPVVYKNKSGSDVVVNQVGWAGIVLGRLDYAFQRNKKKNLEASHTVVIGKKTSE